MNSRSVFVRFVVVAACLIAIAGCNRGYKPAKCEKPKEYHEQVSIPPLVVPDDLDAPDPAASVQIPDLPGAREGGSPAGPCLEDPPDYFDTSPT